MKSNPQSWKLTDELFRFTALKERVPFTLANACEGIISFGSIGSGKTSGPGTAIPLAMLRDGYGMLVLCAKLDEAERLRELAVLAGRENDIVMFGPEYPARYNFLEDLLKGGSESVVKGFEQVTEAVLGKSEKNEWMLAAQAHLRMGIEAFTLAGKPLRLPELSLFLKSLDEQATLFKAVNAPADPSRAMDYEVVKAYFMDSWAKRADETRASVQMSLDPALDPFCLGKMRELFCTDTNIRPEDLRAGKIIIVNVPILGEADVLGKAAGVIWKYMVQRCLQKFFGKAGMIRSSDSTRPVCIYVDECHYYSTSYDATFQTTARGALGITFYLTQTINNFWNALGGQMPAKSQTAGLLDTIQGARIMCQNGSDATYQWFMGILGKELQSREGRSASFHGQGGGGASVSIQRDVLLDSRDFQVLAKGNKPFRYCVTAIIQVSGRTFRGGKIWTQAAFPQIKKP